MSDDKPKKIKRDDEDQGDEDKWWLKGSSGKGKEKWKTLSHNGLIFSPPYVPHGVKMLYDGKPVTLTPFQEEIATQYAQIMERDVAKRPIFQKNFFAQFKKILGKDHIIKEWAKCDFTPLYEYHMRQVEAKRQMTKEEKKVLSEKTKKETEKYQYAMVDGKKEKVGNFRVEAPGLFQGRGDHPRSGYIKRRIEPEDIIINIGEGEPIPELPPTRKWKKVVHLHDVTWLAAWKDPISNHPKYVFLAANSRFRGESDVHKFQKARCLHQSVDQIRTDYWAKIGGKRRDLKQLGCAVYLIDKLAIRAGNEKGDDTADTVGCCTLKVENVSFKPPTTLHLDFLGKDSIRYDRDVEIDPRVLKALQEFVFVGDNEQTSKGKRKSPKDLLFDTLNTSRLNNHLKSFMPGLTAKTFRTYNACITLQDQLEHTPEDLKGDQAALLQFYTRANFEVARLCNHQRALPKTFEQTMWMLEKRRKVLEEEIEYLRYLRLSKGGKDNKPIIELKSDTKSKPEKKTSKPTPKAKGRKAKKIDDDELDSLDEDPQPAPKQTKKKGKVAVAADDSEMEEDLFKVKQEEDFIALTLTAKEAKSQLKIKKEEEESILKNELQEINSELKEVKSQVLQLAARVGMSMDDVKKEEEEILKLTDSDTVKKGKAKVKAKAPEPPSQPTPTPSQAEDLVEINKSRKDAIELQQRLERRKDLLDKVVAQRKEWSAKYDDKSVEKLTSIINTLSERSRKMKLDIESRNEGAMFAVSTSRLNYLDPRLSVAWCKKWGLNLSKIFSKTLRDKFPWAMDVDETWRFENLSQEERKGILDSKEEDSSSGEESGDDEDTPKKAKKTSEKTARAKPKAKQAKQKPAARASASKKVARKKKQNEDSFVSDDGNDESGASYAHDSSNDEQVERRVQSPRTARQSKTAAPAPKVGMIKDESSEEQSSSDGDDGDYGFGEIKKRQRPRKKMRIDDSDDD
ncbi:putative DNA topoisomerase 1 beta [Blattamonas nauphoetae]|uniref:DNA topoisomerase 1 n=1 Tax=Blattamonas nauphoetae TaxID=2049346 RepID=A0ABQ9XAY8_9EUKA|nr:putative DNA topoisomerase 1 beta [Blattamonas nauphoetae]